MSTKHVKLVKKSGATSAAQLSGDKVLHLAFVTMVFLAWSVMCVGPKNPKALLLWDTIKDGHLAELSLRN